MFKYAKFILLATVFSLTALSFAHVTVHAAPVDPKTQACEALGVASGTPGATCDTAAAGPNVDSTIKLAINGFSLIVGLGAVIMIIVGGFKYVISQGESSNTASAKNTILYAIVGLIVVAFAQIIVKFTLAKTTKLPTCPAGQSQIATPGDCTPKPTPKP